MGARKKIGDGNSTLVWQEPWLPCVDNGFMTTERYPQLKQITVFNLMDENQEGWDEDILDDLCNERDKKLIKQLHVPMRKRNDSWYWLLDDTGRFTVRSCYRKIKGESDCPDRSFWRKVWGLKLPGKVINFIWRMCREVLPTSANLITKHVNIVDRCAWCQNYVEDTAHVMFLCEFAREVWAAVGMLSLIAEDPGDTVLQVTKRIFNKGNNEQRERVTVSSFGVKSMALNMKTDWSKAREVEEHHEGQQQMRVHTWCKPPEQWIKINTDAVCHVNGEMTGLGCVARDESGQFVRARSRKIQVGHQPRIAEALSMREALSWTKEWRSSRCVFETDAKTLVDAINKVKESQGESTFDTIVDDCRELIKHFEEVLIVFVPRSANSVAHLLAKGAYSMSGLQEWVHTAPDFLICNLDLDMV